MKSDVSLWLSAFITKLWWCLVLGVHVTFIFFFWFSGFFNQHRLPLEYNFRDKLKNNTTARREVFMWTLPPPLKWTRSGPALAALLPVGPGPRGECSDSGVALQQIGRVGKGTVPRAGQERGIWNLISRSPCVAICCFFSLLTQHPPSFRNWVGSSSDARTHRSVFKFLKTSIWWVLGQAMDWPTCAGAQPGPPVGGGGGGGGTEAFTSAPKVFVSAADSLVTLEPRLWRKCQESKKKASAVAYALCFLSTATSKQHVGVTLLCVIVWSTMTAILSTFRKLCVYQLAKNNVFS